MNELGLCVLSGYDRTVLRGARKSKGDLVTEGLVNRQKARLLLGQTVQYQLGDGTVIEATAEELVLAAAIGDAIEKGSFEKAKAMYDLIGEDTSSTAKSSGAASWMAEKARRIGQKALPKEEAKEGSP